MSTEVASLPATKYWVRRDVALLPATEIKEQTMELDKGLTVGLLTEEVFFLAHRSYLGSGKRWYLFAVLVHWTWKIPVWDQGCGMRNTSWEGKHRWRNS